MSLDINKTYNAILQAARRGQFVTYGDVVSASGMEWKKARQQLFRQLDELLGISHQRGWPAISAIVVNETNVATGQLEGKSLEGLIAGAKKQGYAIHDPQTFLSEQQQAVFEWSKSAPDDLGLPSEADDEASGPRFVYYFNPVLDALRALGGSATPEKVCSWIREHHEIPAAEIDSFNKGGQSKFENKVAWARFYLVKAGLIDGTRRGVWALTSEGTHTSIDEAESLEIFRKVQSLFKMVPEDEEQAPEIVSGQELFSDPERRFWFVGAAWNSTDDQTARFYSEGIWQNGHNDRFGDEVSRMRPGDRIAIKSTYTRRHKLPFDNKGKPVSCMRIKAIGIITENLGDRRTVKVDWTELDPAREWLFYTYRVTIVEADRNDDLARRLILFAFADAKQDYDFWISRPYFARSYGPDQKAVTAEEFFESDVAETEQEAGAPSYTVDNICDEGCFLSKQELDAILERIRSKLNLVLQGPPGTGKTWLAKRLAFALIGSKDLKVTRDRLRVIQFHPSLSYEDFVRGWRPSGDGKLALVDGTFLEIVEAAKAEPDRSFVLVIEEINRGNPGQIFGEVLTLLEDSKRGREDALELAYRKEPGERVYVPRNLYVIGTMNIADRSLALVDLALRRRFAFFTLEPQFNDLWRKWCSEKCGLSSETVSFIEQRMSDLNVDIGGDRSLGMQYRIGHSYLTPQVGSIMTDGRVWFRNVIHTEIIPLLNEYWFDSPEKVEAASGKLLQGL